MTCRRHLGILSFLVLGPALLAGCSGHDQAALSLTTASIQPRANKVQLASVRAKDAETAAQIAANGALLYGAEASGRGWGDYCKSAHLLANAGNFREAVREASKAFYLGQRSADSYTMAHASRDLAFAYSLAGDMDSARRWAEAALKYARRSASTRDTAIIIAPAQRVIGDVELRAGRIPAALAAYEEALKLADARLRQQIRTAMANAEIRNRNFARARQLLTEATGDGSHGIDSYIRRAGADLAFAEGNAAEALRLYTAAAATGEDYDRVWAHRGAALAARKLGREKEAVDSYRKAIEIASRMRAQFHSEEFKTGFFGEVQTVYDEMVDLLAGSGATSEALAVSEQGRARATLDLIRGRATLAGAGSGNAEVEPAGKAEPVSAIRAALAGDQVLLVYHTLAEKTYAWTVTSSDIKLIAIKIGRRDLESKVRRFREQIQQRGKSDALAAELYATLIAPAHLLVGASLIVVPHKAMHLLPFQALKGPGGWLVQERAISRAPSASALVALRSKSGTGDVGLLALGNPQAGGGDPPLPGAESEVKRIAALVKSAQVHVGMEATKARLLATGPSSNLIHIAAHSTVDDLDPLYSTIRLAPTAEVGGDMEAHEVYRLRLGATRLVVLSSCDSGNGRISAGDEFWGFQRTFLGAGVRSLLLTQWPVVDDSTPQLMERFYAHLQTVSAAQALRNAQLDLIKGGKYADPTHWAAFTLVGSPT